MDKTFPYLHLTTANMIIILVVINMIFTGSLFSYVNYNGQVTIGEIGKIFIRLDRVQENRTDQFKVLFNQTFNNQQLLKEAGRNITDTTANNLNYTLHNRAMLDDTNNKVGVIFKILGINDTSQAMQLLRLTHNDTEMIALLNHNLKILNNTQVK